MTIYDVDTDKLTSDILSLNHKDCLEVSCGNGDDGAYEFYRLHDHVFCFDENRALIMTLFLHTNAHLRLHNVKMLEQFIQELKSWT